MNSKMVVVLFQINLLRMSSTNDQPMALESLPIALDSTRISNVQPVAATSVSSTNQPAVYVDEEKRKKLMRKANVHRLNELILGGYSDIVVQVISTKFQCLEAHLHLFELIFLISLKKKRLIAR